MYLLLFENGNNRALRLPSALAFEGVSEMGMKERYKPVPVRPGIVTTGGKG